MSAKSSTSKSCFYHLDSQNTYNSLGEDLLHEVGQLSEFILELLADGVGFRTVSKSSPLQIGQLVGKAVDVSAKVEQTVPILRIEFVGQASGILGHELDGLETEATVIDTGVIQPSENQLI